LATTSRSARSPRAAPTISLRQILEAYEAGYHGLGRIRIHLGEHELLWEP
jgi:hypothetical protein